MTLVTDGSIKATATGTHVRNLLPLVDQRIVLEFACFRVGVIHVPRDLLRPPAEVLRSVSRVQARGKSVRVFR